MSLHLYLWTKGETLERHLKGAIPERIREGLEKDPVAQTLLKNGKAGLNE